MARYIYYQLSLTLEDLEFLARAVTQERKQQDPIEARTRRIEARIARLLAFARETRRKRAWHSKAKARPSAGRRPAQTTRS